MGLEETAKYMKIWKGLFFEYSYLVTSAFENTWDLGNPQKI